MKLKAKYKGNKTPVFTPTQEYELDVIEGYGLYVVFKGIDNEISTVDYKGPISFLCDWEILNRI